MKTSKNTILYDVIMAILALVVILIMMIDISFELLPKQSNVLRWVDNSIWVIFCLDYVIRFFKSEDKIYFFKNNKVDLISIIPFNALFKALRVFKVVRVVKVVKLAKVIRLVAVWSRFKSKISVFIKTNNFNYVLSITVIIIFIGAVAISFVEGMSFSDSLWWSFVTTTTVGYGDISPTTGIGRIIAVVLMLIGIGFIGMLTGTIATYFLDRKNKKVISYKDQMIEESINKLRDFESLTKEDLQDMFKVLETFLD